MTDLWEQRLRDFSRTPAPVERMRRRISDGPTWSPSPPHRGGLVTIVVALSVFAAGGALAWSMLRPSSGSQAAAGGTKANVTVATPDVTGGRPIATFSNGLATSQGALDEYSWKGDAHAEPFPPTIQDFLEVVRGTPVRVRGENEPDQEWLFLADPETFEAIDGTRGLISDVGATLLDAYPGDYVLVLQESWGCVDNTSSDSCFASGSQVEKQASLLTFYFGVRVVP
jgi:hypothetical protein